MRTNGSIIMAVAAVICAFVLASAYKYKYQEQKTIVVTGLGEEEFTSDMIIWSGSISTESTSIEKGFEQLNKDKERILEYIESKGVDAESVVFMFVNSSKINRSVYSDGGYRGEEFTGKYRLSQNFSMESNDVEAVEDISREISSLIAQGITLDAYQPSYYYSKLDDLKISLIEKATEDAKLRAEKIAEKAGCQLKDLKMGRMGVFQITGANVNEEFSAGGSFNTSSKDKKARITMRLEYTIE